MRLKGKVLGAEAGKEGWGQSEKCLVEYGKEFGLKSYWPVILSFGLVL